MEDKTIAATDLDAAGRTGLSQHSDREIRARCERLLGAVVSADRQQVIDGYHAVRDLSGDPERGAALFKKNCAACHKHRDVGTDVGPRLAALQNKTTDFLLTSILDPNRAVDARYVTYVVATKDGRVFSGMIAEETGTHVTLVKPDGTRDGILRVDIEELAGNSKSFMPEGLERELAPQDLADVISFVQLAE